jgi:hypothetical protein
MPTVPPNTVIKSLTGGDPDALCAILPRAVREIVAWAQAVLGADPGDAGIADLVYAPILTRDIGSYVGSAPIEVAERARPLLKRAQAATNTLRHLGISDAAIQRLASDADARLGAADSPDGVTIAEQLRASLKGQVRQARLINTAIVFSAGQPDPATLLNLGYVSPDLAQAAGYGNCPEVVATI